MSTHRKLFLLVVVGLLYHAFTGGWNSSSAINLNLVGEDGDGSEQIQQVVKQQPSNTSKNITSDGDGSKQIQQVVKQQPSNTSKNHTNDCGIYYYYHVGKTGGTSVMQWQKEIAKSSGGKIQFVKWLYLLEYTTGIWKKDLDQTIIPAIDRVASHAQGWVSIHQHHRTPGLRFMIPLLQQWRSQIEAKGCTFVTAVTIREPVSWIHSLVTYNQIPDRDLSRFLNVQTESQFKYLLFNFFARHNGTEMQENHPLGNRKDLNEEEMNEVLSYLRQDFDIVGQTENMTDFFQQSLSKTGWLKYTNPERRVPTHANKSRKRHFSPEFESAMVRSVQRDQFGWKQLFEQDNGGDVD